MELLRDIGKHFSIGRMLQREFVRTRLAGTGISYTEFSYVLLQSYDFLTLFRERGITLQLGGSDQWGNITGGADLIRRATGERVHCLATPLLTKADGTKMGKTEGGGVWLDPELTSPYAFHQFFLNTADTQIAERVKIFSFKRPRRDRALLAESAAAPHLRLAQRALADEVTTLVHGADAAASATAAAQALFGGHDLREVDEATLASALAETPRVTVPAGTEPGYVELFADSGLVSEPWRRQADDRRGRRLREQRAGERRGRCPVGDRPAVRPVAGPAAAASPPAVWRRSSSREPWRPGP